MPDLPLPPVVNPSCRCGRLGLMFPVKALLGKRMTGWSSLRKSV